MPQEKLNARPSSKEPRTAIISYRLTEGEKLYLEQEAQSREQTLAQFTRRAIKNLLREADSSTPGVE